MTNNTRKYRFVLRTEVGHEINLPAVESALRRPGEPGSSEIILIHDSLEDPLAHFPDLAARCHAVGIGLSVYTTAEHDRLESQEDLSHIRQKLASPDSDVVIDAASRAGPCHVPPLPGTDALAEEFVQPGQLHLRSISWAPPGGPMAAHLGDRIPRSKLFDGDERLAWKLAIRVRAWRVRSLIGTAFVAVDDRDIPRALEVHVQGILGLPVFVPRDRTLGGARKFLHLHVSAPTPPDPNTGQPMFLELYGNMAIVGDHDLRTVEGGIWRVRRYRNGFSSHELPELPGPIVIRLASATWSNVSYPGAGVPFYL
jgi:hypothetical protein